MKKILVYVMAAAMVFSVFAFNPVEADAAPGPRYIAKEGSSSKTFSAGNSFELEVNKGSEVKDSNLWWSVGNSKIVKFNSKDKSDEDVSMKALKAGKTKVTCVNKLTGGKVVYTITVKKATKYISKSGDSTRTVNKGSEFDLKVKLGGLINENKVKWTIADTSIVGYDDDDRYDNEMEFYAKKGGTTKITAKNLLTGGKVVYTIKVKQPSSYGIFRVGNLTKTVELGDEIDLRVNKGDALSYDKVEWTIEDPSILAFEDGNRYGPSVEVEGLQIGTSKVTVQNLHSGAKINYTIKVVPDYD